MARQTRSDSATICSTLADAISALTLDNWQTEGDRRSAPQAEENSVDSMVRPQDVWAEGRLGIQPLDRNTIAINESLVSACELFLVPSAILFGAIGVATTDPLKTMISAMGLVTCILWAIRLHLMLTITPQGNGNAVLTIDVTFGLALAYMFAFAYLISLIAHGRLWRISQMEPPMMSRR
jgi:hypothetical protein